MSIESVMPSNHLILCLPFLLLPSIFPSIRVFSIESTLHIRWPKYCSFSFSNSASNEYSGLISLRINWFDLFAVQGTLKRLLRHHNSKASILHHSVSFMVQFIAVYDYRKNHSFDASHLSSGNFPSPENISFLCKLKYCKILKCNLFSHSPLTLSLHTMITFFVL